jgi:hypothetical protein
MEMHVLCSAPRAQNLNFSSRYRMDAQQPQFTLSEILTMIRHIGQVYLSSSQYDVQIEEDTESGDSTRSHLNMSTFLMKAIVRQLLRRGVHPAQLQRVLAQLDAPEETYPVPNKGLTVLATTIVRFSDNDSPVRAER